jgi:hypothetical protein
MRKMLIGLRVACLVGGACSDNAAAAVPLQPSPRMPLTSDPSENQQSGAGVMRTPPLPTPCGAEELLHFRCHGDTIQICGRDAEWEAILHGTDTGRRCSEEPQECVEGAHDACCVFSRVKYHLPTARGWGCGLPRQGP